MAKIEKKMAIKVLASFLLIKQAESFTAITSKAFHFFIIIIWFLVGAPNFSSKAVPYLLRLSLGEKSLRQHEDVIEIQVAVAATYTSILAVKKFWTGKFNQLVETLIVLVCISRTKAKAVSEVIANVTDVLARATGSQAAAKDAIDKTEQDIKMAEDILQEVTIFLFIVLKHGT